jgi:hypothetical protein
MINIYLYGKLRDFGPDTAVDSDCSVQMAVQPGDTIADVLRRIGIAPDQIVHLFLNHQYSALTRQVHDGDRLGVFGHDMALLYRQYFPKQE